MKIVCFECQRGIGEKFPFDDLSETHTFCRKCIERRLIEIGKKGLRGKFTKNVIRVRGA